MEKEMILNMKKQMKPSQETVDGLMEKMEIMQEKNGRRSPEWFCQKMIVGMVTLAAFLFVMLSPTGKMVAEQVKSWMAPKEVTEEIEGSAEINTLKPKAQVNIVQDDLGYVVYVNEKFFASEIKDGVQTISSVTGSKAKMTISFVEEVDIEKCFQQQLKAGGVTNYQTEEPLNIAQKNKGVFYTSGMEWNDTISRIYCIESGKKGCFVVKYENTIEEDEGYGSRFKSLLNTFELVKK